VIKSFASRQFVTFLVTGGIAAAVNFASRIVYNVWVDFSTAVVLAYLTGMVTAFVLARLFVFRDTTQPLHRSVLFFGLVNILAIAQTWLVSMVLAYYVLPGLGVRRYASELAHAAGVVTPVFTSYLGHRRWSFR
jgi:putative flippase GtrA